MWPLRTDPTGPHRPRASLRLLQACSCSQPSQELTACTGALGTRPSGGPVSRARRHAAEPTVQTGEGRPETAPHEHAHGAHGKGRLCPEDYRGSLCPCSSTLETASPRWWAAGCPLPASAQHPPEVPQTDVVGTVGPLDVHLLIPGGCEYGGRPGKGELLVDGINADDQLALKQGGHPESPGRLSGTRGSSRVQEARGARGRCDYGKRSCSEERSRGCSPRKHPGAEGWALDGEKTRHRVGPGARRRTGPADLSER